MMAEPPNLDVLGTFLKAVQVKPSVRIIATTRALEPDARLSDVFQKSGLSEDEFARNLGEAESQGLIRRETTNMGIRLVLTPAGRQFYEQSVPQ